VRQRLCELETREQTRVIVASTVQMAHALGLRVVAQSVETDWAKQYLESVGCDFGQGYRLARPTPGADCRAWVQRVNGSIPERLAASRPNGLRAPLRSRL
jgi:EAL domain-containing protein (putative c-di-GMP-specific phosphodiesterase class I)